MADPEDRSLIPLPDGSLANTAAGATRILAEMRGETLSIAQSSLFSQISALEAEITNLERMLDEAGEYGSLFDVEIAILIMRYAKAVTALETLTWQPARPVAIPAIEAEIRKLEQELEEVGGCENLFHSETAALVKHCIKTLATHGTAMRQKNPPSQTDLLRETILRLEEQLREVGASEELFYAEVAVLVIRYARAVAELGDISHCCQPPDPNGEHFSKSVQEWMAGGMVNDPAQNELDRQEAMSLFQEGLAAERVGSFGVAFDLFKLAATLLHTAAQYKVGWCYEFGKGVLEDRVEALKWYSRSASQGFPEAQFEFGYAKFYGLGLAVDRAEGVSWFRRAAMSGNIRAQEWLGRCYDSGWEVERDDGEALNWFRKAAEQGDVECQMLVAGKLQGGGAVTNLAESVNWFRKAADRGEVRAQLELGHCYRDGLGVMQDSTQAASWYRKAAQGGDYHAMSELASLLYSGDGVPRDAAEAVHLYQEAAEYWPDSRANYNLGLSYLHGDGVPVDFLRAYAWLRLVLVNGEKHREAEMEIANLAARMSSTELREATALYEQFALKYSIKLHPNEPRRNLSASEERELGVKYRDGVGISQDYSKAVTQFRRAAKRGDGLAHYYLSRCYKEGHGVGIDLAEACALLQLAITNGIEASEELVRLRAVMSPRELSASIRLYEAYRANYLPSR